MKVNNFPLSVVLVILCSSNYLDIISTVYCIDMYFKTDFCSTIIYSAPVQPKCLLSSTGRKTMRMRSGQRLFCEPWGGSREFGT